MSAGECPHASALMPGTADAAQVEVAEERAAHPGVYMDAAMTRTVAATAPSSSRPAGSAASAAAPRRYEESPPEPRTPTGTR
jgi:hypothetical protein